MPFDNVMSRADLQAGVTEQVSQDFLDYMTEDSATLQLMRRIPVGINQVRFPVISALPTAYFVNGDTGLKQTTEAAWTNKYLDVEEIAAIVPVPDAVLDDSGFDVWGEMRPLLTEAIGRVLDAAVWFGVNKPSSWPAAIATAAAAAGNTVTVGTAAQGAGGIAEDVNDLMGTIEADGFDVTGFLTKTAYKARFRGARDTTGQPLVDNISGGASIYGEPVVYSMRGLWPTGAGSAEMFALSGQEFVVGVRQDVTFKLATEAVITDNTGAIVYNLFQQDMSALRVLFRVGWQVRNTINREQPVEASRYPAGVMVAA
jgi:HK97 family phage major capsid protein